jgi:hypothetical protein
MYTDGLSDCYFIFGTINAPNVASEWLKLLLRITEVPSPNLGPEIGSPD